MTQANATANTEDFEFAALHEAKIHRAALLKDFALYLHGNVLEVGAGIGQFSAELLKIAAIHRLVSIEPDPTFCDRLCGSFPGHELVEGTVADLRFEVQWNAIFRVNVLEHIEDDCSELRTYFQFLRPAQGALCFFVPARPEIYAPIDRDFGHFRRYSREELREKLEGAGFTRIKFRYSNFVGYFLWWASFCGLKQRTFNPGSSIGPSFRLYIRSRAAFALRLSAKACSRSRSHDSGGDFVWLRVSCQRPKNGDGQP